MIMMGVYVVLVAIGEVIAFAVSEAVDPFIPDAWSITFAMALFFGVIWAMWPIAVYVTEKWFITPDAAK